MSVSPNRGLSVLDLFFVLIVVGVLVFAAAQEFSRYQDQALPRAAAPSASRPAP